VRVVRARATVSFRATDAARRALEWEVRVEVLLGMKKRLDDDSPLRCDFIISPIDARHARA